MMAAGRSGGGGCGGCGGLPRLGALLGALLWAGLGTPAGGQHANDRVVFSFTSSATLKGSIAGADRPYSNDSRLPNASVVTLVETDTAGSSTLAPWHGPLMEKASRVALGSRAIDEVGQRVFTLDRTEGSCTGTATVVPASCTGIATDTSKTCDLDASTDGSAACPAGCTDTAAYTPVCDLEASTNSAVQRCPAGCQYSNVPGATLRGVDLISGADRFETTIPFFPVTGIAYYAQEGFDGLIITVRQTCTRRFCREVEPIAEQCVANDPSNAALVQLCEAEVPSGSVGTDNEDACNAVNNCIYRPGSPGSDHGLDAVVFHPTTGEIVATVDLPSNVTRVQSGLVTIDLQQGHFYFAALRTSAPAGAPPFRPQAFCARLTPACGFA